MSYQIDIDTGGTFTYLIVVDEGGGCMAFKSLITPNNYIDGIINHT